MATVIHGVHGLAAPELRARFRRFMQSFAAWRTQRRQRRQILRELYQLDDRDLRDMAITRYDFARIADGTLKR